MSHADLKVLESLLTCPCEARSPLARNSEGRWQCQKAACPQESSCFLEVSGQPVLIDFSQSVCQPETFRTMANGSIFNRKRSLLRRIVDLAIASPYRNPITTTNLAHFIDHLPDTTGKPTVLVIGGGTVGNGMTALYDHPAIDVVAFDIYASGETDFVADAHAIPLKSGTIAGVWIQAVLEHVLEPVKVVAEIQRVLQPEGIVYAETPFMQQVHEQAYDFTRFTESGHRWLFKEFHLIDSGVVSGPGTVLIWAIRQFFAALFQNQKIGSLISYLFFWLGFCDRWMPRSYASDGASAVFFLGRKAHQPISPRDAIAFYQGVQ